MSIYTHNTAIKKKGVKVHGMEGYKYCVPFHLFTTHELQIVIINFLKLPKTSIQTYRKAV